MKFGREYEAAVANEHFPREWMESAIDYKQGKKLIKKVHLELEKLGLDDETLSEMRSLVARPLTPAAHNELASQKDYFSAAKPVLDSIQEEFIPTLRILVNKDGEPLNARLSPETRQALRKLAQPEVQELRLAESTRRPSHPGHTISDEPARRDSTSTVEAEDARWVNVPLDTAGDFFAMLEPKVPKLEAVKKNETRKLEEEILDLGDAVEDVVQPVMEGYEARREISYRDLYFWREMFRLYLENPIFYKSTEQKRGAITYKEAKGNLEAYDKQLRETGLLAKMKTPQAKAAAQKFLDLNLEILKLMYFQEINYRGLGKILKKFDKQTHLEGDQFLKSLKISHPDMLVSKTAAGGLADSIARDLQAEMGSKVLAIVPQLDDWICPVCYGMAWRPVNLGCCRSVFCIRCIIQLQDNGMEKCPMCNADTVMKANGMNIDFDTMDFLGIYFPMEVKKRQKENEKAQLIREYGEEYVKPGCTVM
ncbi:Transcriptional regulator [Lecanosticta acicola]|uniref:Transcriptional regulator n=1 Tax=Lecanosticta acicola TaxID=111012 RepID=A0AAI8YZJ5_9PEZI|nr:Transcriptional regulator [Lecanosticta acicola]